jgi:TRAP-type C4-dicarboxylate transport system permease small subunit
MKGVLRGLQRANAGIDWLLCRVVFLVMAILVILLLTLAIGRYLFGFSPIWMWEVAQNSFVWLSMLGICVALHRRAHVSLEYMWEKAPARFRRAQKLLIHAAVLIVGASMAKGGIDLVNMFGSSILPGLGVSVSWVYASPIVSGVLICLFDLELLMVDLGLLEPPHNLDGAGVGSLLGDR